MSRIGRLPIEVPKGVTCTFSESNKKVSVKGPKGELHQDLKSNFKVKVENNTIEVTRPSDDKPDRALHGLYRALINNMVIGVSQGYKEQLELIGVGYKASAQGKCP